MKTISVKRAGEDLAALIREVSAASEPVMIEADGVEAVLLSAADWSGLQETLYLQSIPGMTESIVEGIKTPLEDCVDEPEW